MIFKPERWRSLIASGALGLYRIGESQQSRRFLIDGEPNHCFSLLLKLAPCRVEPVQVPDSCLLK